MVPVVVGSNPTGHPRMAPELRFGGLFAYLPKRWIINGYANRRVQACRPRTAAHKAVILSAALPGTRHFWSTIHPPLNGMKIVCNPLKINTFFVHPDNSDTFSGQTFFQQICTMRWNTRNKRHEYHIGKFMAAWPLVPCYAVTGNELHIQQGTTNPSRPPAHCPATMLPGPPGGGNFVSPMVASPPIPHT